RVARFVLQPQVRQAELGAEPVRPPQRRPAVPEVDVRIARGGQQRLVPPQRSRPRGDRLAGDLRPDAFLVVERLDRSEAFVADRTHLGRVAGLADPAPQSFQITRHGVLLMSPRRAVLGTEEARRRVLNADEPPKFRTPLISPAPLRPPAGIGTPRSGVAEVSQGLSLHLSG